jgi:hypothetical protein
MISRRALSADRVSESGDEEKPIEICIRRRGTRSKCSDRNIGKTIAKAPKHAVFFSEIVAPFLEPRRVREIL